MYFCNSLIWLDQRSSQRLDFLNHLSLLSILGSYSGAMTEKMVFHVGTFLHIFVLFGEVDQQSLCQGSIGTIRVKNYGCILLLRFARILSFGATVSVSFVIPRIDCAVLSRWALHSSRCWLDCVQILTKSLWWAITRSALMSRNCARNCTMGNTASRCACTTLRITPFRFLWLTFFGSLSRGIRFGALARSKRLVHTSSFQGDRRSNC